MRKKTGTDQQCFDLNYMVFTYGKYHNNVVNQLIHTVFVPIIIYTWYVQMCLIAPYLQLSVDLPVFGDKIGFGFWINFIVSTAYFFIDWRVALICSLWWWPCMVLGNATWMAHEHDEYYGLGQFWFMGLVNIVSWIMQFIGHGLFEKRSPAITTNILFGLLAPFFITFELMNGVFGFQEGQSMQKLKHLI